MTIGKVIRLADALKPNAIGREQKYQYINEVEGFVQSEVMLLVSDDIVTYDCDATGADDTVLLVKPPHDKLYIAYLVAMIDYANGEYNKYANTIEQFNTYYAEYHRWYFKHFHPADGECVERGYYLSAYTLAVLHGFVGDEDAFVASMVGKSPEMRYTADGKKLEWKYTDEGDDAWRELIDLGTVTAVRDEAVSAAVTAGENAAIAQQAVTDAQNYAEQAKESSTLGMTAAKVGDYAKVAEVDENGVPTRFEAAEGSGGSFVVTLTKTDSIYSADRTFAEISAAIENGLTVIVRYGAFVYNLIIKSDDVAYFSLLSTFEQGTAILMLQCKSDDVWSAAETFIEQTANRVTQVTSASTDTEYPSAKAAYTLAANSKTIIVKVTQGSTITADKTFAQISAAINSGRLVAVLYSNCVMMPTGYYNSSTQEISFAALSPATGYTLLKKLKCTSANEWTYSENSLEHRNNLVTSIGAGSGNTQYPSAKAVYDAIQAAKPDIVTPTKESTDTQAASAKAVWDMLGGGGSGTDISLGVTSAAVGDIIKVKAVDDSGKPTAWEAVTAKLANPNALTFTGAVTGSYDGSEAKTIEIPSGVGGGVSYRSWSKVWTLAVAEDIAGFEASNIDLDGKSEIMIVFISDSTASRSMTNGRLLINGVDVGKVLFNSLPLKKDSHSFIIIGRADDGIEYTTMAAKAEYQSYPWQGDVNVVHRMVRGTNTVISWIADSTIEITQGSATLGQGITIEIYVR